MHAELLILAAGSLLAAEPCCILAQNTGMPSAGALLCVYLVPYHTWMQGMASSVTAMVVEGFSVLTTCQLSASQIHTY